MTHKNNLSITLKWLKRICKSGKETIWENSVKIYISTEYLIKKAKERNKKAKV